MKLTTTGYIKDGAIVFRNLDRFKGEIIESNWTEFEITVEKKKKSRSAQQNRWWWACMAILSNELGYRKEEIHEICKYKFLKRELVDENSGEVFEYLKSTTDLTTTEFSVLIESVIQWAQDTLKITLPLPNTQLQLLDHQK